MTVRSPGGSTASKPEASLAPPVPPARMTTRVTARARSVEVLVDRLDRDAEGDPFLGLEASDFARDDLGLVGVIAGGHLGDVGLRDRLVGDRFGDAGESDPLVAVATGPDR